ncbi:Uncharacterized membrane protein YdjX, TVP38/TMEM64 family, SNARE-associated domain [Anaerovirgula multivorans]|uniref:TVP38/TMEM64 family membrane protein n=1 Tax=Anaerovirgula multivorans TaxID=312168 RepID=A0A239HAL4_9FIRM|nr:TVP38/TMEM64 family protein [Anaerovirgula multivorans]SNS77863.1 Uncharacterized membrane protein YdjX, TVP38/TMEM64 family, SNARE-associated domain [Anaerovirgula multivorans]
MNRTYLIVIIVILFILVFSLIHYLDLTKILSFENLKSYKILLKNFVHNHYFVSLLSYIVIYIIIATLGVPVAIILSLLGGFLFGVSKAVLFINISATIGATITFLLSRHYIGSWVQNKYKKNLSSFNKSLQENGKYYLLSIRLVPVFPFILINLLCGLTNISTKDFIWTTSIGIIPSSIIYAYAGVNLVGIESPKEVLTNGNILAFILLSLLALTPIILKKLKITDEKK